MSSSFWENFTSPLALFRFYGVCVTGLALDLGTKYIAETRLDRRTGIEFVPGLINFEWVVNHGAVFGIGQGHRWLFVAISLVALVFLTWLFANSKRQWFYQVILGMLLAGVLGNLYDRITYGYVRDMIRALPQWPNLFPYVFNVADMLLCTGVSLMLLHALLGDVMRRRKTVPATPVAE